MKQSSRLLAGVSFGAILLAIACSGDEGADATTTPVPSPTAAVTTVAEPSATTPAATPTAVPAAATTAPVPTATPAPLTGLEGLSLVYVDTRRGQGGDIYVAEADGANPRLVLSEPRYRRPMDVMAGTLAAVGQDGVLFIDLESGDARPIDDANVIFSGRFFDAETFLYSSSGGCTAGGASFYRVELPALQAVELFTSDLSLTIAGLDDATNTVAVLPHGCDVGIAGLDVYDILTGELRDSLAVEGCGWAIAALDQSKAVTSWQSCTPPANHAGADATVYDFGIVGPTGNDVTVPVVDPSAAIWMQRPGRAEVAFGTSTTLGAGPGSTRSAGIYVLGLANRQFRQIVEGEGAEQYPIGWSPDGRYLLYAVVEAQGVCHFAYVDAGTTNSDPVRINPEITFCGVNGNVVGWTQLP